MVVHGHTPVPEPEVLANRVNVDTGAFASGRLTALVIDGAEKRLLTVEDRGLAGEGGGDAVAVDDGMPARCIC